MSFIKGQVPPRALLALAGDQGGVARSMHGWRRSWRSPLMRIARIFTDHPASLGETYTQHCGVALSYAGPLAMAAFAATVHAFLPFLFKTTATSAIQTLSDRMSKRCSTCALGPVHRPDLFPPEPLPAKHAA